jgi:hypothetical protein
MILRSIAAALVLLVSQVALAQNPLTANVPIDIRVEEPVFAGLPIWLDVNVHDICLEANYPMDQSPAWFGVDGATEILKDGRSIPASPFPMPGIALDNPGLASEPCPGSTRVYPEGIHRFPLHLAAALDTPGHYAVRWVIKRSKYIVSLQPRPTLLTQPALLVQSRWVSFTVQPSTAAQREAWLRNILARRPHDNLALKSDFIPSVVVAWHDPRVTRSLSDLVCLHDEYLSQLAMGSLVHPVGPSGIAYFTRLMTGDCLTPAAKDFFDWHSKEFEPRRTALIQAIVGHFRDPTPKVKAVIDALSWSRPKGAPDEAQRAVDGLVLAEGPKIISGPDDDAKNVWLNYVSSAFLTSQVLPLIRVQASQTGDISRYALGILCAQPSGDEFGLFAQAADNILLGPAYGQNLDIPSACIRRYGTRLIPLLRMIMTQAAGWHARDTAAQQLDELNQPDGTAALIEALNSKRDYEPGFVANDLRRQRNNRSFIDSKSALTYFTKKTGG